MDQPRRLLVLLLLLAYLESACSWQACTTWHLNIASLLDPLAPSAPTGQTVCRQKGQ